MGVHDGHRERLKNRFLTQGLDGFEDHNVLELLLFYSIPRMDTNEIAHNLLEEFGSLSAVFDAPAEALCTVKGVSTHTATLIKIMPQLFSRYDIDKTRSMQVLNSVEDVGKYLMPRFRGKKNEEFYAILLDGRNRVLKCHKVFEGSVNATQISLKKLIAAVVNTHATGVIIAHNHPGSIALPSDMDVYSTGVIFETLKALNIKLIDHVVFAEDDFVSFSDSNFIRGGYDL